MDRFGTTVPASPSSNLMTMRHSSANGLSPISDTSSTSDRSPLKTSFLGSDNHSSNGGDVAHRACEKCRSSKRRCDKTLPYCTRCSRLNAKCVYLAESMGSNQGTNGAPVVIFQPQALSNDVLLRGSDPLEEITTSQVLSLISTDVQSGEKLDWIDAVRGYFDCVHSWYAVVHQGLFEQQIAVLGAAPESPQTQEYSPPLSSSPSDTPPSLSQALAVLSAAPEQYIGRDLALLIATMYLVTRTRHTKDGERTMFDDLYRFIKRVVALALVENSVPKIQLVQCGALLAMYEYGHGDSLMAYRTLSDTVAAARVLGVQPGRMGELSTPAVQGLSGAEIEQNGYLWWSVFVLDQFIHRDETSKHLPFVVETPEMDTLLPGPVASLPTPPNTGRFDVKYICESPTPLGGRLSISAPISAKHMDSFQLSAKVASLFHRALRHEHYVQARPGYLPPVNSFSDLDEEIRQTTLTLLQDDVNWQATLDCFAMSVAALFTLYLPYLPLIESKNAVEIEQDHELKTALAALRFAAQMSTDISCRVNAEVKDKGEEVAAIKYLVAPAAPTCYFVVMTYASLRRIYPEEWEHCQEAIRDKYESLRFFSYRWGIAEKIMCQLQEVVGLNRNEFLKPEPISPVSFDSGPMDLSR